MTASAERAKSIGLVVAVVVALAFTVALWSLGWVSTLSFVIVGGIYVAIRQGEDRKTAAFNSYRLGDTLTRRDVMGPRVLANEAASLSREIAASARAGEKARTPHSLERRFLAGGSFRTSS